MPIAMKLLAACAVGTGAHGAAVFRGSTEDRAAQTALAASSHEAHFAAYLVKHGWGYTRGTQEWNMRYDLYMERLAVVESLNSRPGRSWTAGLNQFGVATLAELNRLLGYKPDKSAAFVRVEASRKTPDAEQTIVDECKDVAGTCVKDWSMNTTSLFIRDQGECGSCWAVTASTVLDAHSELHGTNRTFSTQHIVDCVPNPHACGGTGGCDGATVELAFMFALKKGLGCPEKYGAYTAADGVCASPATASSSPSLDGLTGFQMDTSEHSASSGDAGLHYGLKSWHRLATNKYAPLMQALQHGPVAVSLAANDLFMYVSGIFDGCTDFVVNHAVTLIGYGKEGDKGFWLVQNSWGTAWGEDGKIRILRTEDEGNVCGEDDEPQQGIACEGETDPVEVCGSCGILFDSVVPTFDKTQVAGTDDLC